MHAGEVILPEDNREGNIEQQMYTMMAKKNLKATFPNLDNMLSYLSMHDDVKQQWRVSIFQIEINEELSLINPEPGEV